MEILTQSLNMSERQRNKTQTSALSKAWSKILNHDTRGNLEILEASRTRFVDKQLRPGAHVTEASLQAAGAVFGF
jgi:hypothetical protein